MQTNNHSNATNVNPVRDFVAMDDYQAWLLLKKNTGITKFFPPLLFLDTINSEPSKSSLVKGLIVGICGVLDCGPSAPVMWADHEWFCT